MPLSVQPPAAGRKTVAVLGPRGVGGLLAALLAGAGHRVIRTRIPADFRLYLTAMPRVLAAARPPQGTGGQKAEIASMTEVGSLLLTGRLRARRAHRF